MIKKVQPYILNRYLCNKGPYIFYFNHEECYINQMMIIDIKELNNNNLELMVLEIRWKDYLNYVSIKNSYKLENVYLYFGGKEILVKKSPDKNALKEVFDKSQQLYKDKMKQICVNSKERAIKAKNNSHVFMQTKTLKEIRFKDYKRRTYRILECLKKDENYRISTSKKGKYIQSIQFESENKKLETNNFRKIENHKIYKYNINNLMQNEFNMKKDYIQKKKN